jgi:ATP-dependent RNA helicase DeaD
VALTIAEPREHRLLRNIERLTRQKIELGTVPTVADLRARRLELTRANLYETLVADGDDLDTFRVVVENLAGEFDLMDVAAAAVKLLHRGSAAHEEDEQEIRVLTPRAPREGRDREDGPRRGEGRGEGRPARRPRRQQDWQATRLFVGAGRNLGVRPGDLVGAIANEARIEARNIGAIEITDRFSLVEVPTEIADDVIRALKGTTIKGQRVTVRRDREAG